MLFFNLPFFPNLYLLPLSHICMFLLLFASFVALVLFTGSLLDLFLPKLCIVRFQPVWNTVRCSPEAICNFKSYHNKPQISYAHFHWVQLYTEILEVGFVILFVKLLYSDSLGLNLLILFPFPFHISYYFTLAGSLTRRGRW